ncbi:hypothetical protein FRB90_008534, partial [Tulasnella sp. 427]
MGLINEVFPPKSKFDPTRDIPDLSDKVIIVTGGNTGIGKQTIQALLSKNAKVYMAARSRNKAEAAIADLKESTGKEALFLQLDLASLDSVTKSAKEFMTKEPALHILFNNGGVITDDSAGRSTHFRSAPLHGYDLQFGTNVLGHAHFTLCLLPALLEGARTSSDGKARVINTSSNAADLIGKLDYETFRDGPKRKKLGRVDLYNQ